MTKRQLLVLSYKGLIGSILGSIFSLRSDNLLAAYPPEIFMSQSRKNILTELFGTHEAFEDGSIRFSIPLEAEHGAYLPFRLSAPGAQKIAVLVERNLEPLVFVAELFGSADGGILGTLKLQKSTNITCYVFRQEQLYSVSRFVRLSVSGYDY